MRTKSNTDIDIFLIFDRLLHQFWLQNRFQRGLERALNEASGSKLRKYTLGSIARVLGRFKLEVFGASGGGKQEGAENNCVDTKHTLCGRRAQLCWPRPQFL